MILSALEGSASELGGTHIFVQLPDNRCQEVLARNGRFPGDVTLFTNFLPSWRGFYGNAFQAETLVTESYPAPYLLG